MSDGSICSIHQPSWFVAEIARDLGLEAGERHGLAVHAIGDDGKPLCPITRGSNWTLIGNPYDSDIHVACDRCVKRLENA